MGKRLEKNSKLEKPVLIDISDDEDDRINSSNTNNNQENTDSVYDMTVDNSDEEESEEEESDENESDDEEYDDDDVQEIILIQKENIESDEPRIRDFIKFCLDKGHFDNTFYDYGNAFSVVATKLPVTFEKMTTDGDNIDKTVFIKVFKETFGFTGDIEYIYGLIDIDDKEYISWEEFTDFFLPFVKYVTI
jgi:hypothetical protein